MILHLTDAEALALSQQSRVSTGTLEGPAEVNVALESAKAKLQEAMQKSDAKLSRSLDYAISSLESSGFDNDQIEALRGAKDKAALHNDKKYVKDEEKKG
tara:strand:- start:28 stop:327 length:300 start_codon:yes stop_codon:yes gene_type:complete